MPEVEIPFPWYPVAVDRERQRNYLMNYAVRYGNIVIVDDQYQGHPMQVDRVIVDAPNEFRFLMNDETVTLRPVRPDDAVRDWGIPLPVEIIGALMSNTIKPPTISAAVDAAGDVHTMILETGTGLYARYSRQWILLSDISPIEQLDIVDVPLTDLEHYDMADDKGNMISIRELAPINPPARSAIGPDRSTPPPAVTAAATAGMIVVASAADLPDAVAFAATNPASQWYVERRWKALGGPGTGVTLPWAQE